VKAREMIVSTALEYLDSLARDTRGDPQLQWKLASAYAKVAEVQGSNFAPSLNHPKDAVASAQKALSLARPLDDRGRLNAEQRAGLVIMLRNLQATLDGIGEFDQAVKTGEEQVARSAGLPLSVQDNSVAFLGTTYMWKGDLEKAHVLFEQSLRLARQTAASNPSWSNRLHLAGSLRQLGQVMWSLTRLEEARALLLEGVSLYRQCIQEQPQPNAQRNLGISLDVLGQVGGIHLLPKPGASGGGRTVLPRDDRDARNPA
jgi:tetratricopeptide (TPR) repeat protein